MGISRKGVLVSTLDDSRISIGDVEIDPSAAVVFAAGLYLSFECHSHVVRKTLQEILWPNASPTVAAHRLRQTLLKLRRAGFTIRSKGRNQLDVSHCQFEFDFDQLSNRVVPGLVSIRHILPGFAGDFSWTFSEWLESKRSTIQSLLCEHLLEHLARARVAGDWPATENIGRCLLHHSPENEEATLALAESLAMRGDKLRAVRLLDDYMASVSSVPADLHVSAAVMRRRIADRMPPRSHELNGETPLLGRGRDLTRLTLLLEDVSAHQPRSALITGEAGIGKSRLLTEFLSFATLQGAAWHKVSCRSTDASRPLAVLLELIPLLRGMRGAIGSAPATLDFFDALTNHRPKLIGNPRNDFPPDALDAAFLDILDAVSEEAVVVLAIEDCHWIDRASSVVLSRVAEKMTAQRVLMLFTSRPVERDEEFFISRELNQTPLRALDDEVSRDVIRSIGRRRGRNISDSYIDWCTQVAEGNPFFLHELANHWLETGEEHASTPSLTFVLKQRLSRLRLNSLQVLQAAALLENHASLENLEALLDYPAHELLHCINELAIGGMVAVSDDSELAASGGRLNSRHDLLSETALGLLATPARAYLHRRAAKVLETRIDAGADASTLWSCAKHWQLAGDMSQAFRLAMSCANHLLEVGLPHDAAQAFAKASVYCISDRDHLSVLEGRAKASYRSSDWPQVTTVVKTARALKHRIDPDASTHDDLELMQLRADWLTFKWDQILTHSLECLRAETASNQHRLEAAVMALMMLSFTDDGVQAAQVVRETRTLPSGESDGGSRLQAEMIFHTNWGSFEDAIEYASSLVALHKNGSDATALFRSLCNAAVTFRAAGRFDDAKSHLLEALTVADNHHLRLSKSRAIPMLAHLSLEQGNKSEAKAWLQALESIELSAHDHLGRAELLSIRARIALLDGRIDEAAQLIEGDLDQMRLDHNPQRRVYAAALRVVVELATKKKPSLFAVTELEEAHLRSRGNVFQAFAAYALYAGLSSLDQADKAQTLLDEYVQLYRREPVPPPRHLLESIQRIADRSTISL